MKTPRNKPNATENLHSETVAIYPFLFAMFPLLSLYSSNAELVLPHQLIRPTAIVLGLSAIVLAVIFVIVKNWNRASFVFASMIVAIIVLAFSHEWLATQVTRVHRVFAITPILLIVLFEVWKRGPSLRFQIYGSLFFGIITTVCFDQLLIRAKPPSMTLISFGWAMWVGFVLLWSFRQVGPRGPTVRALNYTGVFLVCLPVFSVIYGASSRTNYSSHNSLPVTAAQSKKLPDVYFFVLDGYGRGDSLKYHYLFNNETFLNKLTVRGFYVATQSKSNYVRTNQSVSATLNMAYHEKRDDATEKEWIRFFELIEANRVFAEFKALGYQTISMMSIPEALRTPKADVVFSDPPGVSMFELILLKKVPFASISDKAVGPESSRRRINYVLERAGRPLQAARPKLTFMHILAPHPPYVFNADGSPANVEFSFEENRGDRGKGPTATKIKRAYVQQLQYINSQVLRIVDQLLAASRDNAPIIVIQGDHGPRLTFDFESFERTDPTECFPTLNALLVPNSIKRLLYDEISPVNTFRIVLSQLSGQDLPLLPDRCFFHGPSDKPFAFQEIDPDAVEDGLKERIADQGRVLFR